MKALNTIAITVISTAATWFASKLFYKNSEKLVEEKCMKADPSFVSELREKILNAKNDLNIERVKHFQNMNALKIENKSLKEEVERLQKVLKATQQKAFELASKEVNHA